MGGLGDAHIAVEVEENIYLETLMSFIFNSVIVCYIYFNLEGCNVE